MQRFFVYSDGVKSSQVDVQNHGTTYWIFWFLWKGICTGIRGQKCTVNDNFFLTVLPEKHLGEFPEGNLYVYTVEWSVSAKHPI